MQIVSKLLRWVCPKSKEEVERTLDINIRLIWAGVVLCAVLEAVWVTVIVLR